MVYLLFGHGHDWYGEVRVHGGAFSHLLLTPAGEGAIGAAVGLWRTKGVPCRHELLTHDDGTSRHTFYIEHVPTRDRGFGKAVEQWGADHGLSTVVVQDDRLRLWESLQHLPLQPQERFAFAIALRETPPDLLHEWSNALAAATSAVPSQSATVKRRVGKRLLSPFQRAKQKQK